MKTTEYITTIALATLTFACVTLAAPAVNAQSGESTISRPVLDSSQLPIRYGIVPFLAADAGYMSRSTDIPTEGVPGSLKLLGSGFFANGRGVADIGFGRLNQKFSQEIEEDEILVSDIFEIGLRYQTEGRWQFGLVGNTYFEQGDRFAANQEDVQFAGLAAHREFNFTPNWVGRFGAKVMNDLNIDSAEVQVAALDFQLGWNFSTTNQMQNMSTATKYPPAPSPTSAAMKQEQESVTPETTAAVSVVDIYPKPLKSEVFDKSSILTFNSASANITSENQRRLERLGDLLYENQNLFDYVELIGHADNTGSDSYNRALSLDRAQSVQQALVRGGLPAIKTRIIAKGEMDPLIDSESPMDLRVNRRVELRFHGVQNTARLESLLNQIE